MSNSLAIRQFMALCRGQMPQNAPEIRVVRSVSQCFRLCLRCQNTGEHDEIIFRDGATWQVCRVCRQLCENKQRTEYALLDDGSFEKFDCVQAEGPKG